MENGKRFSCSYFIENDKIKKRELCIGSDGAVEVVSILSIQEGIEELALTKFEAIKKWKKLLAKK